MREVRSHPIVVDLDESEATGIAVTDNTQPTGLNTLNTIHINTPTAPTGGHPSASPHINGSMSQLS